MGPDAETQRVDKWLWAARMFKTRSLAAKACQGGHVTVNDTPAKAARPLRVGDRIEVLTGGGLRVLVVLVLADKRGPAGIARTLYDDQTPPPPAEPLPTMVRERGAGRPSKRERRQIDRLRGPG